MSSFSVWHWAIFGAVAFIVWRAFASAAPSGEPQLCTACGHQGPTTKRTKGSFGIELVLWLLMIVPGLIYSLWRLSSRHPVCSACGATALVPVDSPVARKFRAELSRQPE